MEDGRDARNGNGDRSYEVEPADGEEKATSSISVNRFKSGVDDFEDWVDLFEKAVKLATNARDGKQLAYLYKEWLPLKLDAPALAAWKQVTETSWKKIKEKLMTLLVDPQEKYRWDAKLFTIKWDEKESLHSLATRVARAVNKYDKDMPEEYKKRECFFRFRATFKRPWRKAIDLGCRADERTIENAKEVTLRYQLSFADEDGDYRKPEDSDQPTVYASASYHIDRATSSIESSLAAITAQLDDISVTLRSQDERLAILEDWQRQYVHRHGEG